MYETRDQESLEFPLQMASIFPYGVLVFKILYLGRRSQILLIYQNSRKMYRGGGGFSHYVFMSWYFGRDNPCLISVLFKR